MASFSSSSMGGSGGVEVSEVPQLLSVFELVVHLSSFKNVDLFRQGLYYIRAQFYTERTDDLGKRVKHLRAMPYHLLEPPPTSPLPPSPPFHSRNFSSTVSPSSPSFPVFPPFIDDSSHTFSSSTFRVQYCEQSIPLNDACLFRLELNSRERSPVYLDLELLYAEWTATDIMKGRDPPAPAQFERVSLRSYLLGTVYTGGVHSYVPVTFDESHFCSVDAMVHSMLMEFRFKAPGSSHSSSVSAGTGHREDGREDERPDTEGEEESSTAQPMPSAIAPTSITRLTPPSTPSSSLRILPAPGSPQPRPPSSPSLLPAPRPALAADERPAYPPLAVVLFPRLHSPPAPFLPASPSPLSPASPPSAPSPPPPLYTPAELSALADRYHLFFLSNLIRAYNHLATTFELYLSHCLTPDTRLSLGDRDLHPHPLTLPRDLLTGHRAATPPPPKGLPDEEKKEAGAPQYLRPAAIDMGAIHRVGGEGRAAVASPSSPSALTLPPHSASTAPSRAPMSAPSSPAASPTRTTASLPSPPTPDDDSLAQATRRHTARRRRSFDHRTPSDYAAEHTERAALASLRAKYHIPRLERLSVRLRGGVGYDAVARTIVADVSHVSRECFQLWNTLLLCLPLMGPALFTYARRDYDAVCQDHWASFVFRESYGPEHRLKTADPAHLETHTQVAAIARRNAALMLPPVAVREVEVNPASLAPPSGTSTLAVEPRDRGGLLGDYDSQCVVFEEAYSRKERAPTRREEAAGDSSPDSSLGSGTETPTPPASLDGVEVSVPPREIEDVDVDHSHIVVTGIDSRPAPAAVLEAGAGATDHQVTRPRQSLSMDTVMAPPVGAGGLTQPLSAVVGGGGEGRGLSRSGSQPALGPRLPSIPSSLSASASFSSASSSSTFPALHKLANNTGVHVYVLCHGYQGNSWDLRSFKHQLALTFPEALVFLSQANETNTEGDIGQMGQRLALEVSGFINDHCPDTLGRLSFVGHSLGGIIARAALHQPVMAPYLPFCHSFMSFASPHLGYLYAENPFLTTGLWFLKKWNKSVCLSQLSMTDAGTMEECYLYRLSEGGELRWFDHVFLLASQQDKYVPFHSARMEMCREAGMDMGKGGRGKVYEKMVENVMRGMEGVSLKRFDVQFVSKKKGLDAFIGRAAHIFFLDQVGYMQLLINVYRHYFTG